MPKSSENHIFHITDEFEKLESIISSATIRLSYSKENFKANGAVISKAAHPMVCFSEYDIENIDDQKITYGQYAIGFEKEWARAKNIGPVLYVSQFSLAAKGMETLLKARQNMKKSNLPESLRLPIIELKCFIKNEIGYNSYTKEKKFDFKAENEWRFVPKKNEIDHFYISQNQSIYKKNFKKHNNMLLKHPFGFRLQDIKIIFVSSETERWNIHKKYHIDKEKIRISNWQNWKKGDHTTKAI